MPIILPRKQTKNLYMKNNLKRTIGQICLGVLSMFALFIIFLAFYWFDVFKGIELLDGISKAIIVSLLVIAITVAAVRLIDGWVDGKKIFTWEIKLAIVVGYIVFIWFAIKIVNYHKWESEAQEDQVEMIIEE